jgi:hypothetical protein
MTGWNQDEKTINFVKEMKNKIDQNKHLMPDAWYWLSLEVDLDLDLQFASTPHRKYDNDYIEWLKKDSELLASRITANKRLKQAYLDRIDQIDAELESLNEG